MGLPPADGSAPLTAAALALVTFLALVDWGQRGRERRRMAAAGPDAARISRMTDMVAGKGKAVQEPLRVYIGLKSVTTRREAGSPARLPRFGGGAVMRFTNQTDHLGEPAGSWGPYRIVFLQYASDAVTFFEPGSLWRRPEWMAAPPGWTPKHLAELKRRVAEAAVAMP